MIDVPLCAIAAIVNDEMLYRSQHINSDIETVEDTLLNAPEELFQPVACPLSHKFAPGVYLRTVTMPKGAFVIGHEHLTEHANAVLRGHCRVMIDGEVQEIIAPAVFVSKPHVRKVLYMVEETEWMTVHVTTETDLDELEKLLIVKSESFMKHELESVKQRLIGGVT